MRFFLLCLVNTPKLGCMWMLLVTKPGSLWPHGGKWLLVVELFYLCKWVWNITWVSFLYARLKNGTYYAVAMSVRPSVCPSVRPSVRPLFPNFSSTCFEISIWNLVYAFSRWHDMSSLSCIRMAMSVRPSEFPGLFFNMLWDINLKLGICI